MVVFNPLFCAKLIRSSISSDLKAPGFSKKHVFLQEEPFFLGRHAEKGEQLLKQSPHRYHLLGRWHHHIPFYEMCF